MAQCLVFGEDLAANDNQAEDGLEGALRRSAGNLPMAGMLVQ